MSRDVRKLGGQQCGRRILHTRFDVGARDTALVVKVDANELALWKVRELASSDDLETYKARRVVVAHGLGIAKSFENRVGLDDLFLERRSIGLSGHVV
jgi:hypothetical protein